MSRSFLNSGTLIVNLFSEQLPAADPQHPPHPGVGAAQAQEQVALLLFSGTTPLFFILFVMLQSLKSNTSFENIKSR